MSSNVVPDKNSPAYLNNLYNGARSNLLLVVVFTFVNILLLIFNSSLYFLFSATFPYYAVAFGQAYSEVFGNPAFYGVGLGLAVIALALYLLCWFLSKKKRGWLVFAAVLFGLDCLVLLGSFFFLEFDFSVIIDVIFHVWVMVSLIRGVTAQNKLNRLVPQSPVMPVDYTGPDIQDTSFILRDETQADTVPLHPVDPEAKNRVLIEAEHAGMSIQVIRSGRTTQFVVNGMVYMEQESLIEGTYSWDIQVSGIPYHYELNAAGQQTLSSGQEELAKKLRLF